MHLALMPCPPLKKNLTFLIFEGGGLLSPNTQTTTPLESLQKSSRNGALVDASSRFLDDLRNCKSAKKKPNEIETRNKTYDHGMQSWSKSALQNRQTFLKKYEKKMEKFIRFWNVKNCQYLHAFYQLFSF